MKKQIIRLTEQDLHNIITESVNRILNESFSHSEEYIMVDVYDVDFKDDRVSYFLDDYQDKGLPKVSVKLEYDIEPYDGGDYYTPPSGGHASIVSCEPDYDSQFKNIIPQELYQSFIEGIEDYVYSHSDEYESQLYDDYLDYEPDDEM